MRSRNKQSMIKCAPSISRAKLKVPAIKAMLLKEAWKQKFVEGNDVKSVFYQTISLSYGFNDQFQSKVDEFVDLFDSLERRQTPALAKEVELLNEFHNQIQELPEQWTVVQLCKEYNPLSTLGKKSEEILTTSVEIHLSLLCYPRWELNNKEPILLQIKECEENCLKRFIKYEKILSTKLCLIDTGDEATSKQIYWRNVHEIDETLIQNLKFFRDWMSPFTHLFTGKFKPSDSTFEANIYKKVDDFCDTLAACTARQRILLSLLASKLNLLKDDQQIYMACCQITTNQQELQEIFMFLKSLTNTIDYKEFEYYPCLLIVDELLDLLSWEMLNTFQETSRLSSLSALHSLYSCYRSDIVDGYLNVRIKDGGALLNPGDNLALMETRMVEFLKYYCPDWSCIGGRIPTVEEMEKIVMQSDIYVYSGHGCGRKYLTGLNLEQQKVRAIIFLFGCCSTKLSSNGMNSEMFGIHLNLIAASCPALVGALWIITDFHTDYMATYLLSTWLNTPDKNSWASVDLKKWKNGEIVFAKEETDESMLPFEPSLLKVMAHSRSDSSKLLLRIKATMVVRGIPVMNLD